MVWPIVGLLIGVLAGMFFPSYIPAQYSGYVAVAILAGLDSTFGGLSAYMSHEFDLKIFISGFFFNTILAAILVFIGDLLNLDLYIAAIVVFGSRLFNNFAKIRRILLNSYKKEDNI